MNEISVVVSQEPGKVTWNFAEIKSRLREELKVYQNTAYTDATIKTAKGDIAELRKLSAAIETRRKEIKETCLEPYGIIESQAKELVALIEEPIKAINDQVKDYDKRRKEAARREIMDYWELNATALPEDIREKAKAAIYDERWENASATKKSWKEGIEKGVMKILDEIGTIKSFDSEFEEDMLNEYKVNLSLQKAIAKMNELKTQQKRILEMERKKQEEEQKRREAEERRKEQEALNQKAAETLAGIMPANMTLTDAKGVPVPVSQETPRMRQPENTGNTGILAGNVPRNEESPKMGNPEAQTKAYPRGKSVRLIITGTPEQITKIQNYIRFTGATYQEA